MADLIEFFGEDVIRRLRDGVRPDWESDLRTIRDRHVCLVTMLQSHRESGHRGTSDADELSHRDATASQSW